MEEVLCCLPYYHIIDDQIHPFMAITFYNDKGIFVKDDALYPCANVIKGFFQKYDEVDIVIT